MYNSLFYLVTQHFRPIISIQLVYKQLAYIMVELKRNIKNHLHIEYDGVQINCYKG